MFQDKPKNGKTILLVDESQILVASMARRLWRFGYEALYTVNPSYELDRIVDFIKIDAFLVALEMPFFSMDGYKDVICHLRARGINQPMMLTTTETSDRFDPIKGKKYTPLDVPVLKKPDLTKKFDKVLHLLSSSLGLNDNEKADVLAIKEYWNKDAEIILVNNMPLEIIEILRSVFEKQQYKVTNLGHDKLFTHLAASCSQYSAVLGCLKDFYKNDFYIKQITSKSKRSGFYSFLNASIDKKNESASHMQVFEKPVNLPNLIQKIQEDAIKAGALVAG